MVASKNESTEESAKFTEEASKKESTEEKLKEKSVDANENLSSVTIENVSKTESKSKTGSKNVKNEKIKSEDVKLEQKSKKEFSKIRSGII